MSCVITLIHKLTHTKPAQKTLSRALIGHLQDSDIDMDTYIICIYTSAHTHTKPAQRRLSRALISRLQHSDIYICHMCLQTRMHKDAPFNRISDPLLANSDAVYRILIYKTPGGPPSQTPGGKGTPGGPPSQMPGGIIHAP